MGGVQPALLAAAWRREPPGRPLREPRQNQSSGWSAVAVRCQAPHALAVAFDEFVGDVGQGGVLDHRGPRAFYAARSFDPSRWPP